MGKKALDEINTALALDQNLAEAHEAYGGFFWGPSQHWQHEEAIRQYRWALRLDPYRQEARNQLALIYLHLGFLDEGLELYKQAAKNSPLDPPARYLQANALFWLGKWSEAVEIWRIAVARNEMNSMNLSLFAMALSNLGRTQEASNVLQEQLGRIPEDRGGLLTSVQAILSAKAGNETEALQKVTAVLAQRKGFIHFHHSLYNIASTYALLNRRGESLKYLWEAATNGFPNYAAFATDPNLKNLHGDGGFEAFLEEQRQLHDRLKAKFLKRGAEAE